MTPGCPLDSGHGILASECSLQMGGYGRVEQGEPYQPRTGHDGAFLRVLAAARSQFLPPTSQSGISAQWSENMLRTLNQRLSKIAIAGLSDAQLWIVLA